MKSRTSSERANRCRSGVSQKTNQSAPKVGSAIKKKGHDASLCILCRRKFPTQEALQRHIEKSRLHKENVLKAAEEKEKNNGEGTSAVKGKMTPLAVVNERADRNSRAANAPTSAQNPCVEHASFSPDALEIIRRHAALLIAVAAEQLSLCDSAASITGVAPKREALCSMKNTIARIVEIAGMLNEQVELISEGVLWPVTMKEKGSTMKPGVESSAFDDGSEALGTGSLKRTQKQPAPSEALTKPSSHCSRSTALISGEGLMSKKTVGAKGSVLTEVSLEHADRERDEFDCEDSSNDLVSVEGSSHVNTEDKDTTIEESSDSTGEPLSGNSSSEEECGNDHEDSDDECDESKAASVYDEWEKEAKFTRGDVVFSQDGYEAKVLDTEVDRNCSTSAPKDPSRQYLIHYFGWNSSYDEWVGEETLKADTYANRRWAEGKMDREKRLRRQGHTKKIRSRVRRKERTSDNDSTNSSDVDISHEHCDSSENNGTEDKEEDSDEEFSVGVSSTRVSSGSWEEKQRMEYRKLQAVAGKNEGNAVGDSTKKENSQGLHYPQGERLTWGEHYTHLCSFMEKHGSVNVLKYPPSSGTPLSRWAEKQRSEYRKFQAGEESSLTRKRIELLRKVDFFHKMELHDNPAWNARYDELCKYAEAHGHCNVPYAKTGLGKFVSHQRYYYKLMKENQKTTMTEERVRKLEKLGFQWKFSTHKKSRKNLKRVKKGHRQESCENVLKRICKG